MPSRCEASWVGHQPPQRRCGDRADAGDAREPPGGLILARLADQLKIELLDALLLHLDLADKLTQGVARKGGQAAILVVVHHANQFHELRRALGGGDAVLYQPNWARSAFTACVRWRTSGSRVLSWTAAACCASLLVGTKRIVGHVIASQIAWASTVSVLPRLT